MNKTGRGALGKLNQQLYNLVSSFPEARSELVDFHFKHATAEYLDAIHKISGQKLLLNAHNPRAIRRSLPMAMVLADTIFFDCAEYIGSPSIALLPISDELASPVLGLSSMIDPNTGKEVVADPQTVVYAMTLGAERARETCDPFRFFGADWSAGSEGWKRTKFGRTSESLKNKKGEDCHVAVGPIHVQIPREDKLLEDLQVMLESGRICYTPFIHLSIDEDGIGEACLKARAIDAILASDCSIVSNTMDHKSARIPAHLLTEIKIPYLEGVSLTLLAQILEDETDSLDTFRTELNRAFEDLEHSDDPDEARRRLTELKRDILEDELDKVRQVCDRLSRMNSLTRIGAYVATGALTVAGLLGLTPPSLVCGSTGAAMATINSLYRNYEEKRNIRRSPMYFAWRLEQAAG